MLSFVNSACNWFHFASKSSLLVSPSLHRAVNVDSGMLLFPSKGSSNWFFPLIFCSSYHAVNADNVLSFATRTRGSSITLLKFQTSNLYIDRRPREMEKTICRTFPKTYNSSQAKKVLQSMLSIDCLFPQCSYSCVIQMQGVESTWTVIWSILTQGNALTIWLWSAFFYCWKDFLYIPAIVCRTQTVESNTIIGN